MFVYIVKRLLLMLVTMFGIVVLTFAITRLAPGDPASLEAQAAVQGGGSGEARANIDDIRQQNRIIYGLDKPLLLNLNGEERSWFVRERLNQSATSLLQFDRQFAERELLDINTAAFDDLLPLLARHAAAAGDAPPPVERQKAILDYAQAARVPGAKLPPEPPPLDERERASLLLHKGLELAPKLMNGGTAPAETRRGTPAERVAAWQSWWAAQLPETALKQAGSIDGLAERMVKEAFASADPEQLKALSASGAVMAVPLVRRVLGRQGDDLQQAMALHLVAETVRSSGWRPSARLVATWLAQHLVQAGPSETSRVARLFAEKEPEWMTEALATPDAEERARLMRENVTVWHTAVLAQAIFSTYDRARQQAAFEGLAIALDPGQKGLMEEAVGRAPERWSTPTDLLRQLQRERRRLVSNWWSRRQYALVNYGAAGHTWNALANTQFGSWMGKVLRFDFDISMRQKRPVLDLIRERLPVTLLLSFTSIFLSYLIAVPIGIFSAIRSQSLLDKILTVGLFVLYSLPSFWVANMLILFFTGGDWFDVFEAVGSGNPDLVWRWGDWSNNAAWLWDRARHLTLPIFCYTYGSFAFLSRQMRSSMLETVRQDFIRTARAKGLSSRAVIFKHALRNSLIPILTLSASLLPALVGGSVIIEQIFTIKGMGLLGYDAILFRDYAIINAIAVFTALLTLVGILLADLSYALADPRITFE